MLFGRGTPFRRHLQKPPSSEYDSLHSHFRFGNPPQENHYRDQCEAYCMPAYGPPRLDVCKRSATAQTTSNTLNSIGVPSQTRCPPQHRRGTFSRPAEDCSPGGWEETLTVHSGHKVFSANGLQSFLHIPSPEPSSRRNIKRGVGTNMSPALSNFLCSPYCVSSPLPSVENQIPFRRVSKVGGSELLP
jgi:hypothetical protein